MIGAAGAIPMGAPELGESRDDGVVPSATRLKGLNKWADPIVKDIEQIGQHISLFSVGVKPTVFEIDEAYPERSGDRQFGGVTAGADKTGHVLVEVERIGDGRERH